MAVGEVYDPAMSKTATGRRSCSRLRSRRSLRARARAARSPPRARGAAEEAPRWCERSGGNGCAPQEVRCGEFCVDTSTDATSCGACGLRCPAGTPCEGGRCQCAPPYTSCPTGCVTPDRRPAELRSLRARLPGRDLHGGVPAGHPRVLPHGARRLAVDETSAYFVSDVPGRGASPRSARTGWCRARSSPTV